MSINQAVRFFFTTNRVLFFCVNRLPKQNKSKKQRKTMIVGFSHR